MSKSYHQRHPSSRNGNQPRTFLELDEFGEPVERRRKLKPYGRKHFANEEDYSQKFGEFLTPVVRKHLERRHNKLNINDY